MLETNPFSLLSEVVPTVVMQGFLIVIKDKFINSFCWYDELSRLENFKII